MLPFLHVFGCHSSFILVLASAGILIKCSASDQHLAALPDIALDYNWYIKQPDLVMPVQLPSPYRFSAMYAQII